MCYVQHRIVTKHTVFLDKIQKFKRCFHEILRCQKEKLILLNDFIFELLTLRLTTPPPQKCSRALSSIVMEVSVRTLCSFINLNMLTSLFLKQGGSHFERISSFLSFRLLPSGVATVDQRHLTCSAVSSLITPSIDRTLISLF